MKARACVVAEGDGHGGTRLAGLRSQAPLVVRATGDAVYLVGGAGGPLGGDDLTIEIEVGPGARLTLRTAAASVVLPGLVRSRVSIRATVASGGELHWLPEPVVAVQGCRHHVEATVCVGKGATLLWREELVLGRHGEAGGSVRTRTAVDLDGTPLLRNELAVGPEYPAAAGPAVLAGARAVGSLLIVGRSCPRAVVGPTAAILPLAAGGVQVVALGDDASSVRRELDAASGFV